MIIETYIDEINKEKYYIDSNTVEDLNIRKAHINTASYGKRKVNLNVKYVPLKKGIKIIASINMNNKDYSGESQLIDSLTFSNALAQAIIKDEVIEGAPLMENMIDQSLSSLSVLMMSDGVIIKDRVFSGVGYVMSKDKKIAVFEKLSIRSDEDSQFFHVDKCVSSFDLSLVESCSLIFHCENFVMSANIESAIRVNLHEFLSYDFLSASELKILKSSDPLENLETIENDIDKFIENRLLLLDDIGNDINIDELFEDIF